MRHVPQRFPGAQDPGLTGQTRAHTLFHTQTDPVETMDWGYLDGEEASFKPLPPQRDFLSWRSQPRIKCLPHRRGYQAIRHVARIADRQQGGGLLIKKKGN